MKTKMLSIFLSILTISCAYKKQQSNGSDTKKNDPRLEFIKLTQIHDSIKIVDSLIDVNIDSSKNRISIGEIKWLFKDTNVSNETFPWINHIYSCPIRRMVGGKLYESYLNVVFGYDTLGVNELDSFCRKYRFVEKTGSTSFENFYGGKHAIIFHRFYVDRVESTKYSDTLLHNVEAGLIKCGYRRYNIYLSKFY